MRRLTRIVSLLLTVMMLLGMSSVAVAQDAASTLEPVTLEWYVVEDSMPDNQTVFDALNAYFKEKINATVNFHFIPISEYGQKVSTILMSGQTVDIVNANSDLNYVDYVKKGAFLPIEDLIQQYAPETYAMIPESFWSAMYVDGHMYGIPSYKDSCQMYCMLYNSTMADNLGLDMSTLSINNYRDIVPFLYQAKELRDEKYPEDASLPMTRNFPDLDSWAQHEVINGLAVVNVPGIEDFEGMGSGETVFNKYATAEYRDLCKTVAKMVTDGVLPYDLFNFDTSRVYNKQGKYILADIGSGYVTVNKDQNSTEWDTAMIPFNNRIASTAYLHNAVECVSATSKNPERAMMLLELLNTDNYVATTIRFGVEGVHWNMSDVEGVLDFTGTKNADSSNRGHYYWYGAQFGSFIHSDVPAGYPANFTELILEANASAIADTNLGFVFDPTPVQNEIAACDSVIGEYEKNLKFGFIPEDEVDANIDEFLAKLEASGASKIVAEAQTQLDAWRAVNKK